MKEKMHDKICEDIKSQNKNDGNYMLVSLVVNFTLLFINWYFGSRYKPKFYEILAFYFVLLTIVSITAITVLALFKGRKTNLLLSSGILKLYKDEKIDMYYPEEVIKKYDKYIFNIVIVFIVGVLSAVLPIIISLNK